MTVSIYHASIAGLAAILLSYIYSAYGTALRKVPGPFWARFTGFYRIGIVKGGDSPENYRSLHRKYGSIVRTGPNHVSISNPAMIPEIYGIGSQYLKTEFYTTMAPPYQGTRMDSMFTSRDPAYHKNLKSQVAQLFSMSNMKNYEPHIDECNEIFVSRMEDAARHNEVVDLAVWLQWYAFDAIGNITFQRKFGFMERKEDVDEMIEGIDIGLQYVKIIGQFPKLHPYIVGNTFFMFALSKVTNIKDTLIKFMVITADQIALYDQDSEKHQRTDFLAQIRSKKDKSGIITHRDEINHLCNNLLAGSDTTAISLRACFYYIIKTPHAYEKLVREIDEAHSQGRLSPFVTYDESLQLPYLQLVIKEAMRMHPGVGFPLERYVPPGGATLCGKFIPGGTNVCMSAPVIHYNQSIFGMDADTFRPERWLEASPEQVKNMDRAMLAFGYGTRTCIGKNISLMEMGKFIPQVLRHFDIGWASHRPEWRTNAAWFWKQSDILVRFRLRSEQAA